MKFFKYHGIGNDFILFDGVNRNVLLDREFCKRICDRNFGIGADGVLYVLPGQDSDITMSIVNADGTIAEMCGNGIRCVAKYAYDHGLVDKKKFTINTLKGILEATVRLGKDGKVSTVTIDMGAPVLDCKSVPVRFKKKQMINEPVTIAKTKMRGNAVSMGNPHFITFTKLSADKIKELGPKIESDRMFPKRTNVEFASVEDGKIKIKVYERGAAWTMACGTGACATTVAAALNGLVPFGKAVSVDLPGGRLRITVDKDLRFVKMEGPAEFVYTGKVKV